MLPINPWLSLTPCNRIVASCDLPILEKLFDTIESEVFFDLYPEPFMGDPDANVYLLTGNPGYSDLDNCFSCTSSTMSSHIIDVHSHKNKEFIWNNPTYPIQTTCPRTGRQIIHPGHLYWQKRLKELTEAVGHNPRLFELEFYPYHSKCFLPFMAYPLPSFDYTKALVLDAIQKNKMIIVLRHETEWVQAIPQLKDYGFHTLNSPRNTYLTMKNMPSTEVWMDLVNRCK